MAAISGIIDGDVEIVTAIGGNVSLPSVGTTPDAAKYPTVYIVPNPDTALIDAFARLRVSNPVTLFDSKQTISNGALIWDDQETSGAGTSSTHSVDRASSMLAVANLTAGVRVRQTVNRMNYQPGKSQLIFMTGVIGAPETGIRRMLGYFDDNDGIFFRDASGVYSWVIRSHVTGTPVDFAKKQSKWNLDTFDGNGKSGIDLDFALTQIWFIDFEWLGVGRVRVGFVVDGVPMYCHEFNHANALDAVYMSTPNLPVRYELENDGTGPVAELEHICSTVISEGGAQPIGFPFVATMGASHLDANASGTLYAAIGLRLKAGALGCRVDLEFFSALGITNDNFEWQILVDPTITGTFAYASLNANSCVEVAYGTATNPGPTVTNGTVIRAGYVKQQSSADPVLKDIPIRLGADIAGVPNSCVLAIRPLSVNLDVHVAWNFNEIQ